MSHYPSSDSFKEESAERRQFVVDPTVKQEMIKVKLLSPKQGDVKPFKLVQETLSRMGIVGKTDGQLTLFQSCHLWYDVEQNDYYVCHFKQLFALEGRTSTMDEMDYKRLYRIVDMLAHWKLVDILTPERIGEKCPIETRYLKVLRFHEVERNGGKWALRAKHRIGNGRKF